ncbi:unnamed protein product [Victoria cruziana]
MTKDCGNHGGDKEKLYRRLFAGLMAFIIVVLFLILMIWLILRPTKPSFVLQDANIMEFRLSSPNQLTSRMQVTVASHNPNGRVGIYYDRLEVYASYMGQQITLRTVLPPTYEGHHDADVWSPFLLGPSVPISPYLAASLEHAHDYGVGPFSIRIDGRLRWKVGSWTSGHYHIHVECDAYLSFSGSSAHTVFPSSNCYTDV